MLSRESTNPNEGRQNLSSQRNTEQCFLSLTLENLTNVSYDNRNPYQRSKISCWDLKDFSMEPHYI